MCYAHDDAEAVFAEISWLAGEGINVWYDEGISPGLEWSQALADAIASCNRFLYFVTPNSVASENCRRELNFAQEEGLDIVVIQLEPTDVPGGLRLTLNNRHAIVRHELAHDVYRRELLEASAANRDIPVRSAGPQSVEATKKRRGARIASITGAAVLAGLIAWWIAVKPIEAVEGGGVLPNSIAVLPFKNLSPDPEHAYFAAGIHEEILSQLSKVRDLSVIARTTMARYADTDLSIPEIGDELKVSTVMEGSVRYDNNRVRIAAQLIDANSGTQLWSDVYERNLEDVFSIQLAIASQLADSLEAEFLPVEQERISNQVSPNPEAYARYLLALSRLSNFSSLAPVHEALDDAVELDSSFATAIAFKGWAYQLEALFPQFLGPAFNAAESRRRMELAVDHARRALAISPNEAFAYLTLGIATGYIGSSERMRDLQRALTLKPNDYRILSSTGANLIAASDYEKGIELMQRSIELNPADIANVWFFSDNLFKVGQWELAVQQARNVISAAPQLAFGHAHLARISAMIGDNVTAKSSAEAAEALGLDARSAVDVARAYGRMGDRAGARRVFDAATTGVAHASDDPYWLFEMYVSVGEIDAAMTHLGEMVDEDFPKRGVADLRRLSTHTLFDEVRDHDLFDDLVARARTL